MVVDFLKFQDDAISIDLETLPSKWALMETEDHRSLYIINSDTGVTFKVTRFSCSPDCFSVRIPSGIEFTVNKVQLATQLLRILSPASN